MSREPYTRACDIFPPFCYRFPKSFADPPDRYMMTSLLVPARRSRLYHVISFRQ